MLTSKSTLSHLVMNLAFILGLVKSLVDNGWTNGDIEFMNEQPAAREAALDQVLKSPKKVKFQFAHPILIEMYNIQVGDIQETLRKIRFASEFLNNLISSGWTSETLTLLINHQPTSVAALQALHEWPWKVARQLLEKLMPQYSHTRLEMVVGQDALSGWTRGTCENDIVHGKVGSNDPDLVGFVSRWEGTTYYTIISYGKCDIRKNRFAREPFSGQIFVDFFDNERVHLLSDWAGHYQGFKEMLEPFIKK